MSELKVRAINAFRWSLFEGISSQGITFAFGIILARILSPEDFGLIGIVLAFLVVTDSIVDAGFGNALIRKMDVNNIDYSTMFYTNFLIGIILYFCLFLSSNYIGVFFEKPQLEKIIKVAALVVVINSLALIQRTILIKELNFKLQSIISLVSSIISGTIAIFLASKGFGIWSLVFLMVIKQAIYSLLLWVFSSWTPSFVFSIESFKESFDYGYKILLSNLINTIYKNIYYVIIGKYFSAISLGYYTRADSFQQPFSSNIALGIRRVSFPVLSLLQNDNEELKNKFRKFIRYSILMSSIILLGLAAIAKPLILILVGQKWFNSIFYTQLLCLSGMLYPLQILNLNILNVKGFSNLNLKLEIIKKIILIPLIYISIIFGIETLLYGIVLFSFIEYFINSFYTGKLIGYSMISQLLDIFPFICIATISFLIMFAISFFSIGIYSMIVLQLLAGAIFYSLIVKFSKISEFMEIKKFIVLYANIFFLKLIRSK